MKAVLVFLVSVTFALSPFVSPEFGGFDPNRYPVPQIDPAVQPAGWAFSIWGLVYLILIFHAAVGVMRHRDDPAWERGRIALFISLAVGSIWLAIAAVSPVWATVLIWIMLISVLVSLHKSRGAQPVWQAGWPVGVYAGWLSAASFVSIGLLLAGYGVLTEIPAAILALVMATAFTSIAQIHLKHWTYGAAVAWGFGAIAAANSGKEPLIAWLAAIAAMWILALTAHGLRRSWRAPLTSGMLRFTNHDR
jgi:hypothetical protein